MSPVWRLCSISILSLIGCLAPGAVDGLDPDQLEVYDVVEEVNQNFYTFMNISADADNEAIKKAFRSLSRVLHPDKSDAPDADVQFRNLVSVYDVLKDANKREHYNEVLKNGLPNWRSAVYYYRHYRKMGLAEMIVILFILITISQYLVGWASYLEKKYTHEQVYAAKIKKQQKKMNKKGQTVGEMEDMFDVSPPSVANTLPVQIPKLMWAIVTGLPTAIGLTKSLFNELLEAKMKKPEPESASDEEVPREKTVRKRKPKFMVVERDDSELPPVVDRRSTGRSVRGDVQAQQPVSGGLWTDDDLAELAQLIKRHPGGTPERWERIADAMTRTVSEVTYMAAKLKDNCYRVPGQADEQRQPQQRDASVGGEEAEPPRKQKTRGGKQVEAGEVAPPSPEWSQLQQRSLENALAKHPKGPPDRWDRIAKCVPDKTREDCLLRYKYLVEMLKKKKETNECEH